MPKVFGIISSREQKACDRVENDAEGGEFISCPIHVGYSGSKRWGEARCDVSHPFSVSRLSNTCLAPVTGYCAYPGEHRDAVNALPELTVYRSTAQCDRCKDRSTNCPGKQRARIQDTFPDNEESEG